MFKIVPSSQVPVSKEPVRLGAPDFTYPDLAFVTQYSANISLFMNSVVLRTALLNSKEFLEKNLAIKIIDMSVSKEETKVEEKPKPKPKPKAVKKPAPGEVEWK